MTTPSRAAMALVIGLASTQAALGQMSTLS
jgi:hypothetical protein